MLAISFDRLRRLVLAGINHSMVFLNLPAEHQRPEGAEQPVDQTAPTQFHEVIISDRSTIWDSRPARRLPARSADYRETCSTLLFESPGRERLLTFLLRQRRQLRGRRQCAGSGKSSVRFWMLFCVRLKRLPSKRDIAQEGDLGFGLALVVAIRPPMMTVWPSGVTATVSAERTSMTGALKRHRGEGDGDGEGGIDLRRSRAK